MSVGVQGQYWRGAQSWGTALRPAVLC